MSIPGEWFKKSYAFIIGINDYLQLKPLKNAVKDAQDIAVALQDPAHNFTIHTQLHNATYSELTQLFESTIPSVVSNANDRVLIYYAGHGTANELDADNRPTGYLLPADVERDNYSKALSMDYIRERLLPLPCRHLLLILDCCFAGSFKWVSVSKRSGFGRRLKKIYKQRFDRFITDPAWLVITSSSYNQEAIDIINTDVLSSRISDYNNQNSLFANGLLKALNGKADYNKDGLITASELQMYLRDMVETSSLWIEKNDRQTPLIFPLDVDKHQNGEYLFLTPGSILNLPDYDPKLNPYKGLAAYQFNDIDAALLYGREKVIDELTKKIEGSVFTVVTGASGTGKSSVIKAGVLPLFKKLFKVVLFRPGADIENTIKNIDELHNSSTPSLFYFDQFEELFTIAGEEERNVFLGKLHELLCQKQSGHKFILSVRSDYEHLFYGTFIGTEWDHNRYIIPPFRNSELREIIEQPALQRCISFNPPSIVDEIISEVQNQPGSLPLLSFLLYQLYEQLISRNNFTEILADDYEVTGKLSGSVQRKADEFYDSLNEEEKKFFRFSMLRMISLKGTELAKRQVTLAELNLFGHNVQTILEKAVNQRLLMSDVKTGGEVSYEPVHDALIRSWGTLLGWVRDFGHDRIELQRTLWETARQIPESEYHKLISENEEGLEKSPLWHTNPWVDELDAIFHSDDNWLNSKEVLFVQASMLKRKNVLQFYQNKAESYRLSSLALQQVENNPTHSFRLAQVAKQLFHENTLADRIIHDQVSEPHQLFYKKSLEAHDSFILSHSFSPDGNFIISCGYQEETILWTINGEIVHRFVIENKPIRDAWFSPKGSMIVIDISEDMITDTKWGMKHVQELYSNKAEYLCTLDGTKIMSIAPDDSYLICEKDNVLSICDAKGTEIGKRIELENERIVLIKISNDSELILATTDNNKIHLWNRTGDHLSTFGEHNDRINHIEFSADDNYFASASKDKTAIVWETNSGKHQVLSHQHSVKSIHFAPAKFFLITMDENGLIVYWKNLFDLEAGKYTYQFKPRFNIDTKDSRSGVEIMPSSESIFIEFSTGDIEILSIDNKTRKFINKSSNDDRSKRNYSPDRSKMITSRESANIYRADLKGGMAMMILRSMNNTSPDNAIRLWDLNNSALVHVLNFESNQPSALGFTKNNDLLIATQSGSYALYEIPTKKFIFQKGWTKSSFECIVVSPDEKYILLGGSDIIIMEKDQVVFEKKCNITCAAFLDNGRFITGGRDHVIKGYSMDGTSMWENKQHEHAIVYLKHYPDQKQIFALDAEKYYSFINEDGTTIKSNQTDKNYCHFGDKYNLNFEGTDFVELRDKNFNLRQTFKGHESQILYAAMSQDGNYAATSDGTGVIKIWHTVEFLSDSQNTALLTEKEKKEYGIHLRTE